MISMLSFFFLFLLQNDAARANLNEGINEESAKFLYTEKGCRSGFDYLPGVNGCFKVIIQKLNWDQATEACRSIANGSNLAAITNAAKQDSIKSYLKLKFEGSADCIPSTVQSWWFRNLQAYWISGQREDPNSCSTPFVWKILKGNQIPFNYTNWFPGEPNCAGNNEHCAIIAAGYDYQWNDVECSTETCPLCELLMPSP